MARPLAITPARQKVILDALANRNYKEAAAAAAGINRDTLYESLRRGRRVADKLRDGAERAEFSRNDLRLAKFAEAVALALAEAETGTVALIGQAGTVPSIETKRTTRCAGVKDGEPIMVTEETVTERPPDWKALAWLLERARAENWAPVSRQQHSGPGGGPIPVEQRVEGLLVRVVELQRSPGSLPEGDVIDVEAREA